VPSTRYLISTEEQPRVRRAADLTGAGLGVLLFLLSWRSYTSIPDPQLASDELTAWIPTWLDGLLSVLFTLALVYTVGLFMAVMTQWRTRLDAARDMVLAGLAAGGLTALLVRWILGEWPRVLIELGLADLVAQFPLIRVAITTAVLLAVAPHLTRPMRTVGWVTIFVVGISGVGLGLGLPSSALGSIGIGAAGASLVLAAFGSPMGLPDPASINASLRSMGVEVRNTRLDEGQSWGVRRLIADSDSHGLVEIKAYGRDATDAQFASRWWRYLWYRDTTASLATTRMQSVEHEALVTMMAQKAGVSVPDVVAAGLGGDDVAILAVDRRGERVDPSSVDDMTELRLTGLWESVGRLHKAGIAHGALTLSALSFDDELFQIGDFAAGQLSAPESARAVDVVALLYSLSLVIGVARAVESASRTLGTERLAEVLPYIQVPAIAVPQRRLVEKPKALVAEIHSEVARLVDAEVEEPVQLRRVNVRSLLTTGLSLFAVYFLITQLSDIDFAAVWSVIEGSEWAWIVVGFVVGQVVFIPEATAMLAAVGRPISMKPTVVLQSAIKFISLAVPSSAGRIAMTAAFLRKHGISFTASLVQGSIDTISGLIVEVVILVIAFATGSLSLGLDTGETEWGAVLLIIAGVVVVVVTLVRRVEKLRDWVMPMLGEAFGALGGVIKDPKRTLALLTSNLGARLVLAVSMWMILNSMDVSLGIWSTLTATVATGLLGGVIPIPGGVGVSEAVLTGFLVLFGVDETTAFAAAVVYRVATFYIPSGYGFFSMKWLERNGYV
jgi:uncharacterized membrane protein YbhN (UPF0104 family)/tRNA A-37 threonylcarbamoyl transferase component Bud32